MSSSLCAWVRAAGCVVVCVMQGSCGPSTSPMSVGPAGGVIASEDEGLTIVLWPGALGQWEDFEIAPANPPIESFGQAYRVTPNVELGVDAEIILRGDLPAAAGKARVGAVTAAAVAAGTGQWRALPLEPGGIDEQEETVRAHDDEIALYYAMLDNGEPVPTTDTGTGTETGDAETTGQAPSFAADVLPIIEANCLATGCHGASPAGGLSLDSNALENLVDVAATINADYTRVVCGDPDNSLLMWKLDDALPASTGTVMPPGGRLPADERDLVRSWIAQDCPP